MATPSAQNIAAQKKMLQSDPDIQFGNQDYRGVDVGNKTTPGGVNLHATIYPPQTDQQGKQIQGASGLIDQINQGLQQQTYGSNAPVSDDWFDNLQQAIGSMGVGPKYGGGAYVPYSAQQLAFEKQQDVENQNYANKYLDILQQKADAGTPTNQKNNALNEVYSAIKQWHDQGYSQKEVDQKISDQANVLTKKGITPAQAHTYAKQLYKDEPLAPGTLSPAAKNAPAASGAQDSLSSMGLIPYLMKHVFGR